MTLFGQFALLLLATLLLFGALSAAMTLLTRVIGAARLRRWVGGGPVSAPIKGLLFFLTVAIVAAALLAERLHLERLVLDRAKTPAAAAGTSAGHEAGADPEEPWRGWRTEAAAAGRAAAGQLRGLLFPLAVTSGIGLLIAGAAPERLVSDLSGSTTAYAIPAAAALGVPVYLPTEALAPLGWALRDAGVGTGPIFAFMITAASLSLPEFVLLARLFRLRLIAGLIAAVGAIAVGGAFLVPALASA